MTTCINFYSGNPISRSGFTLIELIATLAIGTILITVAVPAVSSMVEENRMVANIYEFVSQLNYSRSTAISSSNQVIFCKSSDGSSCDSDADWNDGWIIFIDRDRNQQRDSDEPLLRMHAKSDSNLDYKAFGSDNHVAFQPSGVLKVGNGTFTFCPKRNTIQPRTVIVAKTGRIRISREKADGNPITCTK